MAYIWRNGKKRNRGNCRNFEMQILRRRTKNSQETERVTSKGKILAFACLWEVPFYTLEKEMENNTEVRVSSLKPPAGPFHGNRNDSERHMRINKYFLGTVSVLSNVPSAAATVFSRILHDLVQDLTTSFPSCDILGFSFLGLLMPVALVPLLCSLNCGQDVSVDFCKLFMVSYHLGSSSLTVSGLFYVP